VKSTRTIVVSRPESGQTLAAVLRGHGDLTWSAARQLVQEKRVRLAGVLCADPTRRVVFGQRIEVIPADLRKAQAGGVRTRKRQPIPSPNKGGPPEAPVLVYADDHILVANKPPGLTTMRHPQEAAEFGARGRKYLPPTLADLLPRLLALDRRPGRIRAVHRIDKDTSGLVVLALTAAAETHLGKQFRGHTIERRYLALVRGQASSGRIESYLVADRGDGRRGSTPIPGQGQRAVTQVRCLEPLGDFTLVECRLETGRTHQVRIHLGERGTPLCGETVYDRPLHGAPLPDTSDAPRIMLHAAVLGLDHPATGQRLRWEAPPPEDMETVIRRLRLGKTKPTP